jgi:hypothetical protein
MITTVGSETTLTRDVTRRSVLASRPTETPTETVSFGTDQVHGASYGREPFQVLVQLETLGINSLVVVRPIPVHVVRAGEGSIASFWDANIHSSGANISDALTGMTSLIADAYQMLSEHQHTLGPEPAKQFAVLREYIQPA